MLQRKLTELTILEVFNNPLPNGFSNTHRLLLFTPFVENALPLECIIGYSQYPPKEKNKGTKMAQIMLKIQSYAHMFLKFIDKMTPLYLLHSKWVYIFQFNLIINNAMTNAQH